MTYKALSLRSDDVYAAHVKRLQTAHALFPRVDRSIILCDMASFDRVVLASFTAQVRGVMFYAFGVTGACRGRVLSSLGGWTMHMMPTAWM